MLDPKDRRIIIDDSSDEEINDDSEDISELNEIYCIEEEANEAFGDVLTDLANEGYDVTNLFDPSWR